MNEPNLQNSNLQPLPEEGGALPQEGAVQGNPQEEGGLSEGDMRMALDNDFQHLDFVHKKMNERKAFDQDRLMSVKRQFLNVLYEMMQELGVDPADPAQVQEMIAQMRESNPDLAEMFTMAFMTLADGLPDSGLPAAPQPQMEQGMPPEMGEEQSMEDLEIPEDLGEPIPPEELGPDEEEEIPWGSQPL